jgi:hypothetical protein
MPNSDQIFTLVSKYLPPPSRSHAKAQFRRAHRQYLTFQGRQMHKYFQPNDMPKNLMSESIAMTGGRFRRIKKYHKPKWVTGGKGRPPNLPLEFFVSRLAFIWAKANEKRTSIRHKGNQISPTAYEDFMTATLNAIGVYSVRKYLEIHSAARSKWRSATIY